MPDNVNNNVLSFGPAGLSLSAEDLAFARSHSQTSAAGHEKRKSKAEEVLDALLATNPVLWLSSDDRAAFITVAGRLTRGTGSDDERVEHFAVNGGGFGQCLAVFASKHVGDGIFLKTEDRDEVVQMVSARCRVSSVMAKPCKRVGGSITAGAIWLNLGRDDLKLVKVTAGGWEIASQTRGDDVPRFISSDATLALPLPVKTPDAAPGLLMEKLSRHINLPPPAGKGSDGKARREAELSLEAFLLSAMMPTGPYLFVNLVGPQGSGKTSATRVLRRLFDPSPGGVLPMPKTVHDLMVVANGSHVLAFDNLSGLSPEVSDAMCRVSTGAAIQNRKLYTDGDVATLRACSPVVCNGIGDVVGRPDLAERTLTVELDRPRERLTETELAERWKEDHPVMLGLLLDAVASALAHHKDIVKAMDRTKIPRMADAFAFAAAGGKALGYTMDDLLNSWTDAEADAAHAEINASPAACILVEAVMNTPSKRWEGSAAQLLTRFQNTAAEKGLALRGLDLDHKLPSTPTGIGVLVRRFQPVLQKLGWTVEQVRKAGGNRERHWQLVAPSGAKKADTTDPSDLGFG